MSDSSHAKQLSAFRKGGGGVPQEHGDKHGIDLVRAERFRRYTPFGIREYAVADAVASDGEEVRLSRRDATATALSST